MSYFGSEDVLRTHDPSGMNRMLKPTELLRRNH